MNNSFDINRFSCSFSHENIRPKLSALSPCLRLKVNISARDRTYRILRNIGKASIHIGSRDEYYLGPLYVSSLNEISDRGSTIYYDLRMSEKEIDKVEDLREKGDDLVLSLELRFLLKRERSDQEGTVNLSNINAEIPRSKWLDFLEQVGYREYDIIAIPTVGDIPHHNKLENAIKNLDKARRSYRQRDPIQNDCRKVVEDINQIVNEISDQMSGKKGERLKGIIGTMERFFDIGSHSQEEEWTGTIYGRDKEFTLGITAQLVNYTAKILNEISNN